MRLSAVREVDSTVGEGVGTHRLPPVALYLRVQLCTLLRQPPHVLDCFNPRLSLFLSRTTTYVVEQKAVLV